jgi:hypothetical protein
MFCGLWCRLIQPSIGNTVFTQKNKIFRSSMWSLDGELLSASYPKFCNFGENPENFPVPQSLNNTTIVEKIDGSCAIWDYVNGQLSIRTRGTFSYDTLENKSDFDEVISKYPQLIQFVKDNPHYTVLTEIVTPRMRIVIDYGDVVDIFLTGIVNKDDYSLLSQKELDGIASQLGIKRPDKYSFSTISNLIDNVEKWEGKEGVVLYSGKDQILHKIKADFYLIRHHMRSEMSTIDKVLDYWFDEGRPGYELCYSKLAAFDFEVAERSRGFISRICDADKEVKKLIEGMLKFIKEQILILPTRKLQAAVVFQSYGKTERANCVFTLLDNKPLNDKQYLKLMYQMLKKD